VQIPEPLTNADIIQMVKANLSIEAITAKILVSRCHFDTNPSVLAELKYRGVPGAVIMAMVEAPYGSLRNPKAQSSVSPSKQPSVPADTKIEADPDAHKADAAATKILETAPAPLPASEIVYSPPISDLPVSGDLAEEITLGFRLQRL
jgi:hypothetical protein